jgi:ElaB/YqjD/DUF883 family membrane-anchored ribosome-binding protein/uncharacterized protein YjbJ (UPF0337 family)
VAQEPFDPLTPARRRPLDQGKAHTESIKREIEQTRVVMSETIGEIQDRLRPDYIVLQAAHGARDVAAGKVRSIMHSANERAHIAAERAREVGQHLTWYAKEHPIRMAITAGLITWWAMRGRGDRSQQWYGASDTSWDYDEYEPIEPTLRDRAGDVSAAAREKIGDYAATARDTVNEYASSAASTARDASRRVVSVAGSATTSVDRWVHANPLAAGAIAVAVGAAIGLAIPGTEVEDRAMGETRDQAWAKARDAAANLKDNVTNRVQAVAEDVVGESLFGNPAASQPPMGHA